MARPRHRRHPSGFEVLPMSLIAMPVILAGTLDVTCRSIYPGYGESSAMAYEERAMDSPSAVRIVRTANCIPPYYQPTSSSSPHNPTHYPFSHRRGHIPIRQPPLRLGLPDSPLRYVAIHAHIPYHPIQSHLYHHPHHASLCFRFRVCSTPFHAAACPLLTDDDTVGLYAAAYAYPLTRNQWTIVLYT